MATTECDGRQLQLLEQQLYVTIWTSDKLVGALDVCRIMSRELWRMKVSLTQVATVVLCGEEIKVTEAVGNQAPLGAKKVCKMAKLRI